MKSALFVDFDNVYSALRRLDPAVAERFAFQPIQWMRWLTDSLVAPPHAPDGAKRRLLVRRCYLNPQAYQRFRPAFNRAGFEIIDCPPMTSEGKTSTDIHMVLDVVDLVQHEVHYDEFIVFSADADFTPLLRKLRRSDRRTTVLAVGFPSAAYQASADLLIDQDDFIRFGLGFADPEPAPTPASVGASRSAADITKDVRSLIARYVAESPKPVSLPSLASKALKEVETRSKEAAKQAESATARIPTLEKDLRHWNAAAINTLRLEADHKALALRTDADSLRLDFTDLAAAVTRQAETVNRKRAEARRLRGFAETLAPDSAEALETRATLEAIDVVIDREAAALAKLEEQISSLHRNVDQSATEAVAWAEQARQRMAEYRKAGE